MNINLNEGTSNVPLILGVIASVFNLPAIICSSVCGGIIGAIESNFGDGETNIGNTIIVIGLIAIVSGFSGSLNAKSTPVMGGIQLLVASVLSSIIMFISFNALQFVVVVLYLIATLIAFTQKRKNNFTENLPNSNNINIQINSNIIPGDEVLSSKKNNIYKNNTIHKKGNPYK